MIKKICDLCGESADDFRFPSINVKGVGGKPLKVRVVVECHANSEDVGDYITGYDLCNTCISKNLKQIADNITSEKSS